MIVFEFFPLKEILYYKIGGNARFVLKIQNKKDLLEALEFVKKNKIKRILPVGLGCNLLVSDNFFDGAVIWFSKGELSTIKLHKDGLVSAFASETLEDVIQFCFKNNLKGLEWAGGLPSTIGGAIRGNAGAFGSEIKDSICKVEVVDVNTGEMKVLNREDLKFSYRSSLIKENKNLIVLSVLFKLSKTDAKGLEEAKKTYQDNVNYRNSNHPMDFPSCGSVFKNIVEKEKIETIVSKWPDIKNFIENKWYGKISMGYIITKLGLCGFTIGGAQVSEKHNNYIINTGSAKFNDVLSIINKVKEKFFQEFGFYPETEVEIVK